MQKETLKFEDSTVFEGMTSIRAILAGREAGLNDRKIKEILFDREKRTQNAKELGYLRAVSEQHGYTMRECSSEELEKLTLGSSHGGIVALAGDRTIEKIEEGTSLPTSLSEARFLVMIQGIEDPYNFGYALRSLYACGADAILLSERNWFSAAGIVCRSSAGASERFPVYAGDAVTVAKLCRAAGFRIVCADERTDNILGECPLLFPLLLIVGGEKRGISRALLDLCDLPVRIDYAREFRASLSAASATTMFAYEIMRQNAKK